ncbi:MAG: hypothetical protein IJT49_05985 [Clostridia bacterium]|nr:hypothetical protein [Clostridia bacterium]
MKKTAKILSVLLAAILTLAVFASCDGGKPAQTSAETKPAETAAETAGETAGETTAEVTETKEDVTTEEVTETEAATDTETSAEIEGDTIKIGSREELFAFAQKVLDGEEDYTDMTILFTADIDLDPKLDGGKNWVPLCTDSLAYATIDGGGHIINGMTIAPEDLEVAGNDGKIYGSGFIGISNTSLTIKNLTFTNALIDSNTKHCGCVIGSIEEPGSVVELENITVSNLTLNGGVGVEGNIEGISFRVGCLVGANIVGNCDVSITNCKAENCKIFGFHNIGGIMGCVVSGQLTLENCAVENVELNYSAGYADNENYKKPEVARYFADPFYCVTDYWGEYHTDVDLSHGNTITNLVSYDIRNDIRYADQEGKDADYPDETYPVGAGTIRPKDERPE